MGERMTIDLERTATELKREKLYDPVPRLKPGGRNEVRAAMERAYKETRLHTYVLLLAPGEPLEETRPLWDKLGLDEKNDLFLVANGQKWEARGWGLTSAEIEKALASAGPAFRQYFGKGLVAGIESLSTAAVAKRAGVTPAPAPGHAAPAPAKKAETGTSTAAIVGGSVAGAAVLGTTAFIISRRMKRQKETRAAFEAVVAPAEKAYAELMLASEELEYSGDEGKKIQTRAAELKKRFDAFVSEVRSKPARMEDPVTLGKIRQYQDEFAALRSTRLQKAKEQAQCSSHESQSTSRAQKRIEEWDPSNGSDPSSEPDSTSGAARKS
jgi:hypothetical protein